MTTSRTILALALVLAAGPRLMAQQAGESALLQRARRLHREVPMIDGHNDFAWEMRSQAHLSWEGRDMRAGMPTFNTDIPRLRAGGVGGQFWSIFIYDTMIHSGATRITLEQIDVIKRMEARYPDVFLPARTAADVMRAHATGKIASLMGVEGGHSIENSLGTLRMFYDLGVRYMTLTWNNDLAWADAHGGAHSHNGLTPFGREVVREMNRLGMLVDISHVSDAVMSQVLRNSEAPVIFSHTSARALADHTRDAPDSILQLVPHNGGVVMVNFYCDFVDSAKVRWNRARNAAVSAARASGDSAAVRRAIEAYVAANPEPPRPTVRTIADHIEHIRDVAGVDHVGYGSDFDGIDCAPVGLENVADFPNLTAELLRRGWSDADVKKVIGLNVLRAMRGAEATARRLLRERPASTATIAALDSTGTR
ncbi:MAG: dipeptidase [Gemmatimonadales bacterium]